MLIIILSSYQYKVHCLLSPFFSYIFIFQYQSLIFSVIHSIFWSFYFRQVTKAVATEMLYSLADMTEKHDVIGIDEGQFVSTGQINFLIFETVIFVPSPLGDIELHQTFYASEKWWHIAFNLYHFANYFKANTSRQNYFSLCHLWTNSFPYFIVISIMQIPPLLFSNS